MSKIHQPKWISDQLMYPNFSLSFRKNATNREFIKIIYNFCIEHCFITFFSFSFFLYQSFRAHKEGTKKEGLLLSLKKKNFFAIRSWQWFLLLCFKTLLIFDAVYLCSRKRFKKMLNTRTVLDTVIWYRILFASSIFQKMHF